MLGINTVTKIYPNGHVALAGFSLRIKKSEIVAIVGGSGCGKSTLLRLVAGLDAPSTGKIRFHGEPITQPRPEIGMVFQEPRLMPWLTIDQNVGFGIRHLPAAERRQRIGQTLARVGLADFTGHWPRELSGGQAQRVSLARALVEQPSVLLLDEPFSALDALTRHDLQEHLLDLWAYDQPTMVLVTHDIEEALLLSDRVVVMRGSPGRIASVATPGLPRPRERSNSTFQYWKQRLIADLHDSFRPAPSGEEINPAVAI
jgi:sulfonate transport system ATP-binding protein